MKRATTSLPVPDSPVSRTVVSVAATLVACGEDVPPPARTGRARDADVALSSSLDERVDALLQRGGLLLRLAGALGLLGQPLVGDGQRHVVGDAAGELHVFLAVRARGGAS